MLKSVFACACLSQREGEARALITVANKLFNVRRPPKAMAQTIKRSR